VSPDQVPPSEELDRTYLPHVLPPVGLDALISPVIERKSKHQSDNDVQFWKLFWMIIIASYVIASTMCMVALAFQILYLVGVIDFNS